MIEGAVGGRFRIDHEVASGGMGVVYRATDLSNGEAVALKRLWLPGEASRRRFEREALVLSTLDHPHIVRYVAHGDDGGQPFLVMEWIEGCTLEEHLREETPTMVQSVRLAQVLAETLGFAHRAGVVHRDIKPANVMLVARDVGSPKLVDFGLAFAVTDASRVTAPGVVAGTYRYMSPEQARGVQDVDARSDVYSLATMLFELITSQRVFEGNDPTELMLKLLCAEPPRIAYSVPDAPPSLDHLVARALSKTPGNRPGDGVAFAAELRHVATDVDEDVGGGTDYVRLSGQENRVVSILLVGLPPLARDMTAPSRGHGPGHEAWSTVDRAAVAHGGEAATLRDGRCVVLVQSEGKPREHVMRITRCALRLRSQLPGVPLALATGRATGGRQPTAESIERLCSLRADASLGVAIDDGTAALLPRGFSIVRAEDLAYVRAEPTSTLEVHARIGYGRKTERRLLAAHIDGCSEDQRGTTVVLVGGPGYGKTHLLELTVAGLTGWTVWRGRADPMGTATPFALLASVLRRALEGDRRDSPEELVARMKELAPGLDLAVLGVPLGVPLHDLDAELQETLSDPVMLAEQVTTATERLIGRYLANGPVVLALDDIEVADPPSMRVLRTVIRAHGAGPLLVLATAKDDALATIGETLGADRFEVIRLGRLSEAACQEWVSLAPIDVPPARARELIEWSSGIPMHLDELLRVERDHPNEDLAPSVGLLLQASLERYPADARRLLQVASVFGDTFDGEGAAHVLSIPVQNVEAVIDRLVDDGILVLDGAARRFRSSALSRAAYAMLTDADRQRAHRRAGQYLRQNDAKPAVIAQHYELAGASDRLAELWLAAAHEAMAAADTSNAAELARRASQGELSTALRVEALLLEGRALSWQGDLPAGRECAAEAMRIAPVRSDDWWTALSRLTVRDGRSGERERFETIARLAIENVTPEMSPPAYVAAVSLLGTGVDVRLLEVAAALDAKLHQSRVREITNDVVSSELYARSRRVLLRGELDRFLEVMEEIGRASQEVRQRVRMEIAMRELGQSLVELGRPVDALPRLLRAMKLSQEMGRPLYEARARAFLVRAHLATGDVRGARAVLAPLLDEATPAYDQTRARARLSDAEIALAEGDESRAVHQAERARAELPEHAFDDFVAAWEISARAALESGDLDTALAAGSRAVELARAHPVLFVSPARAFVTLADVLDRLGRGADASALRAESRALIEESAKRITDDSIRESYVARFATLHTENPG